MFKKIVLAVILAFACLTSVYCLAEKDWKLTNPNVPFNASVGKEFSLVLESNATTGYQWQLAKNLNKKFLKLVRNDYIASQSNLVGAGGKEIWIFKALKPGKTTIRFKYIRPWEKNTKSAKTTGFTIVITP